MDILDVDSDFEQDLFDDSDADEQPDSIEGQAKRSLTISTNDETKHPDCTAQLQLCEQWTEELRLFFSADVSAEEVS